MQGAKPWQIALIGLAILAVIASVGYQIFGGDQIPDRPTSITLIDVQTGELIVAPFPKDVAILLPAVNPQTKETSLFPVEKDGEVWKVSDRHASLAKKVATQFKSNVFQSGSSVVAPANPDPKEVDVFGS